MQRVGSSVADVPRGKCASLELAPALWWGTLSNGPARLVGYRTTMMPNESDAAGHEWIVVCVRCLRIKRDGKWTNDRAQDVIGKSSGFCERCAKEQRKRQSIER